MVKKVLTIFFSLVIIASLIIMPSCSGGPTGPQTLTANIAGEPAQIDPNRASWSTERTVIMQVFEGLLGFNQDLSLKAVGATEIPTVDNGGISADGKTYTFKLRSEVTWSDGEQVTASDYEYSIKRLFDPDLAAEYTSFYFDIVGGQDYYEAIDADATTKAQLHDAVGVTAVDDYTLEIQLTRPRPTFLQLMALWPVYPVRQDIIEAYGDLWTEPAHYIGNGPFIMTEWVHSDHITFIRNENYWGDKPNLETLTWKMITDANSAFAAYQNGELDIAGVPTGTEKTVMADPVLGPQILRYAELVTFAFQFNVNVAPFDNVYLRKALNAAIDRESFINNVRGGVGQPAYSWIPPGMPGYDATLGSEYHFDVTQAKAFLAQAGYADGSEVPELHLQYADTGGNPTISQFIQQQMKVNLNIDVVIEPMERAAFSQAVNSEQYTWAWYGWGADYPDPDNWLPELFGTGAGNNHTGYSNPAFDQLMEDAANALDNTQRLAIYAQAQAMVVDDAPILFMFYRERFVLVKPWVKGLLYTGMDGDVAGDMFISNVWIENTD
jgi:oligopeptide transport system substrate-binding protein